MNWNIDKWDSNLYKHLEKKKQHGTLNDSNILWIQKWNEVNSLPSKIGIETLIERDQKFYRKLSIYLKLIFLAYQKL